LVEHAALAACTKQKAVGSDEFLSDPMACHWSPRTLVCNAGQSASCLTEKEAAVVQKLYDGPRSVYPGVPRGSEFGWGAFVPASGNPPYAGLFHWTFGPDWPWQSFDFDKNVATVDGKLANAVNATNPDLAPFRALGHKLIVYHGWDDWLVPPEETVLYSQQVFAAQRAGGKDPSDFYRLFMVPGMAHCSGGPGLSTIDALPALEAWVEGGTAPQQIVAHRKEGDAIKMSRPVCPYPETAHYTSGNPNQAESFTCKR
jgi:feruloyl esterase